MNLVVTGSSTGMKSKGKKGKKRRPSMPNLGAMPGGFPNFN